MYEFLNFSRKYLEISWTKIAICVYACMENFSCCKHVNLHIHLPTKSIRDNFRVKSGKDIILYSIADKKIFVNSTEHFDT